MSETWTGAVSQEAAQRIAADEAALAEQGLIFKNPTLYAYGTEMLDIGKAVYQEKRQAFERRPLLSEVREHMEELIAHQDRQEHEVLLSDLQMDAGGKIFRPSTDGRRTARLAISDTALNQLVARSRNETGPGGGSYLASCPPVLRAQNVNHWTALAWRDEVVKKARKGQGRQTARRPIKGVLRTLMDGAPPERTRGIFAVVSPGYERLDAPEVFEMVKDLIAPTARGEIRLTGPRWRLNIHGFNTSAVDPRVGDIFRMRWWVKGCDDGTGSVIVGCDAERINCINCTTVWAAKIEGGVRHYGKQASDKLQKLVRQAASRFDAFTKRWAEAAKDQIVGQIYEGLEPQHVFQLLVEQGHVSAAGVSQEELVERLVKAWAQDPGYQRRNIIGAVTLAAHSEPWRLGVQESLEAQSKDLLYNQLVLQPQQLQAVAAGESAEGRFTLLEID